MPPIEPRIGEGRAVVGRTSGEVGERIEAATREGAGVQLAPGEPMTVLGSTQEVPAGAMEGIACHSRESGNPLHALDPRLRGDDRIGRGDDNSRMNDVISNALISADSPMFMEPPQVRAGLFASFADAAVKFAPAAVAVVASAVTLAGGELGLKTLIPLLFAPVLSFVGGMMVFRVGDQEMIEQLRQAVLESPGKFRMEGIGWLDKLRWAWRAVPYSSGAIAIQAFNNFFRKVEVSGITQWEGEPPTVGEVLISTTYISSVRIKAMEDRGGRIWITYYINGGDVTSPLMPGAFLRRGTAAYEAWFKNYLLGVDYLPQAVGLEYILANKAHYKKYITGEMERLIVNTLKSFLLGHSGAQKYDVTHSFIAASEFAGLEIRGGKIVLAFSAFNDLLMQIYRETGDDVITLGFASLGSDPQDLLSAIKGEFKAHSGHSRKGVAASRRDVEQQLSFMYVDVLPEAIEYFRQEKSDIGNALGVDTAGLPQHLFSAGSYRDETDHELYVSMRRGDEAAIAAFAGRMAGIINGNEALKRADIIIPIPGRETWGMPVNTLAINIADQTGIPVIEDVWSPRPKGRMESEVNANFGDKEKQAGMIYKLRGEKDVKEALAGKTVILIDDNYTTGATARAAARELRKAGAKEVYVVVATKTYYKSDEVVEP